MTEAISNLRSPRPSYRYGAREDLGSHFSQTGIKDNID
jgi:hypothetical protein